MRAGFAMMVRTTPIGTETYRSEDPDGREFRVRRAGLLGLSRIEYPS